MLLAVEPQTSGIYVSLHTQGLFMHSKRLIRARNIAPRGEQIFF